MKKFVTVFLFSFLFLSCEEVVEVELQENDPKLVIEASLLWKKGTPGNNQVIKLTTTAPFFDDFVPPATDASVTVYDRNNRAFIFGETSPGIYQNTDFITEFDAQYRLEVIYNEEIYTAQAEFIPTPPLQYIEQNSNGGFNGDDIELKAFFTDPVEQENYYLFRFFHEDLSIQIYDDEFTNGNLTFAYFTEEDLTPGEEVGFEIQGISRRFYEYMFILRSQSGSSNGGPFQTQPTTVRGNIKNITKPENFAFGFFRLSETDDITFTIQ